MLRASSYDPAFNVVSGQRQGYRGTPHTVGRMIQLARGPRGEQSFKVRRHAEQIVSNIRPKDYASEVVALYHWWTRAGRYTRDPLHVELLKDPERMVDDALQGRLNSDCDELATAIVASCLVIGAPAQFVTVGFRPGQKDAHTHVFARAQDPRSGVWWVLDPVAGRRVGKMLNRVKHFRIYPV